VVSQTPFRSLRHLITLLALLNPIPGGNKLHYPSPSCSVTIFFLHFPIYLQSVYIYSNTISKLCVEKRGLVEECSVAPLRDKRVKTLCGCREKWVYQHFSRNNRRAFTVASTKYGDTLVETIIIMLLISIVHYDTVQKVAGWSPDEVIAFFSRPNPSGRTMVLGSTQPLTNDYQEFSWGNARPASKADAIAMCDPIV
jgi:hypothetical protein